MSMSKLYYCAGMLLHSLPDAACLVAERKGPLIVAQSERNCCYGDF